jgi:hypothetical protein
MPTYDVADKEYGGVVITGDICNVPGFYWSSGCAHPSVGHFVEGRSFPPCPKCWHPIKWQIKNKLADNKKIKSAPKV